MVLNSEVGKYIEIPVSTQIYVGKDMCCYIQNILILHMCSCRVFSVMSDCAMLQTAARQAPLSVGFSRQEDWRGMQCPPPGDLPDPGVKPTSYNSCIGGGFFTTSVTWGAPVLHIYKYYMCVYIFTYTHTYINASYKRALLQDPETQNSRKCFLLSDWIQRLPDLECRRWTYPLCWIFSRAFKLRFLNLTPHSDVLNLVLYG